MNNLFVKKINVHIKIHAAVDVVELPQTPEDDFRSARATRGSGLLSHS